jgi:hypothetical protein
VTIVLGFQVGYEAGVLDATRVSRLDLVLTL